MALEWKDVLGKIGQIAPAVGAVFGAPGVAIGAVISAVINAFGLKPDSKPDDVIKAIEADPQAALKLLMAKQDYELKQSDNRLKELEIRLKDTQDARARDTSLRQGGKQNVRADIMLVVAFIVVVAIYWICAYYGEQRLGSLIVGSMLTAAGTFIQKIGTAFDFEFGSSRSSLEKTELLARAEPVK